MSQVFDLDKMNLSEKVLSEFAAKLGHTPTDNEVKDLKVQIITNKLLVDCGYAREISCYAIDHVASLYQELATFTSGVYNQQDELADYAKILYSNIGGLIANLGTDKGREVIDTIVKTHKQLMAILDQSKVKPDEPDKVEELYKT